MDSTKFVSAAQDAQTSFESFLNQIGTSTSGPTLKTNPNSTMHVSTYTDQGPYYAASRAVLGVRDLTDLIFNVREAMENSAEYIGVFGEDGKCKGVWSRETDVEYGEGEDYDQLYVVDQYYDLLRDPSAWDFRNALKYLKVK